MNDKICKRFIMVTLTVKLNQILKLWDFCFKFILIPPASKKKHQLNHIVNYFYVILQTSKNWPYVTGGFTQRGLLKSKCVLLGVVQTHQPYHTATCYSSCTVIEVRGKWANTPTWPTSFLWKPRKTFRIPLSSTFQTQNTVQNVHNCFEGSQI